MSQRTIRTLFVEDEPDVREIIQVALGLDPGFEVTTFPSGVEAYAALQRNPQAFDLALLDLHLPAMSGLELHERLRHIPGLEAMKTILITAALMAKDLERSLHQDVLGVIHKPFHPMRLAADIRAMLTRAVAPER